MDKTQLLLLKKNYEFHKISLSNLFQIECEDAYVVRDASRLSPITQHKCRAKQLAIPLIFLWLDLNELLERID